MDLPCPQRVEGSPPRAGDNRTRRAGLSLRTPDSTRKARNDRKADLLRLTEIAARGWPSGVQNTMSLIRDLGKWSGVIVSRSVSSLYTG